MSHMSCSVFVLKLFMLIAITTATASIPVKLYMTVGMR